MHHHIFHGPLIKMLSFYIHFINLLLIINIFYLFNVLITFAHLTINKFIYALPIQFIYLYIKIT